MTIATRDFDSEQEWGSTAELARIVDGIVARHACVGLAVGVVRDGRVEGIETSGFADLRSRRAMSADTVVRVASISKTFTAIAVMQLWEEGLIDLDAPVNDYLRSYRLVAEKAGSRTPTVRQLLTHTGGLGEVSSGVGVFRPDFGESFEVERAPRLPEFYGGRLTVASRPGTRWIYNNHGPATLGQMVEDVRRRPLRKVLLDGVFEPLGMIDTDLERSVAVATKLATGYEIGGGCLKEAADRDMVTAGAAGVFSTPVDMCRYLLALVNGGGNHHGSVIDGGTLALMYEPHHQPHPLVPGTGLGFWRYDVAGHRLIGHQGTIPGFHSQILAAPDDGAAVFIVTNGAHKPDFWLPAEANAVLARTLGVERPTPESYAHHPEIWRDICGWYRLDASATDVRLRGMLGLGVEVFLRNGRLMIRFLTPVPALARGFALSPDSPTEPEVFRLELDDDLVIRVIFGRDIGGSVDRLHFDIMPLTLSKQPGTTNPRRVVFGSVGAALALLAGVRALVRRPA